jgi:protein tyrosine phosphatase (PTP) superfamily phosphohydrolase (DUF442 family)
VQVLSADSVVLQQMNTMRKTAALLFLLNMFLLTMHAQSPRPLADDVIQVQTFDDLYRYQNFYISSQPEVTRLTYLKDQGIRTIINLQTEEEREAFKDEDYDERFVAEKLGFSYFELPIENGSGFTAENQAAFNDILETGTPTFIHCSSGRRATYLFIAYLVGEQGIQLQEAIEIGKKMKYSSPLEQLLGKEIYMEMVSE